MEFNRNQYLILGLVVLLLGVQMRLVETYVLNEKSSRFIADRLSPADESSMAFMPSIGPTPHRTLRPPIWLGYALISVGAVLVLHSLAMKKPGG